MSIFVTVVKKYLNRSELAKNVFVLVQGTVAAQLITILMQPVLRRLFTPDDFGVFALYSSAVGVLAVVASGRYEMAIMLPKEDRNALALFRLSVITSMVFNVALFLLAFLFGDYLVEKLLQHELIDPQKVSHLDWLVYAVYLVPLGVFVMSMINAINMIMTRHKVYKALSAGKVVQTGLANASHTGFGFSSVGFMGLLYGQLIGLIASAVFYFTVKRKLFVSERGSMKTNLSEYQDFPIKSVPSGLINMLALQLPNFMIFAFFGAGILGLYDVITKVLNIPMMMIGKSVSQVFYQKISADLNEKKPIGDYVRRFSLQLFVFMLLPMLVIVFFGEQLFGLVFGEEYELSGHLAAYFAIFFLVRFVYFAQSTLFSATRKLGIELRQNSLFLVSQLAALLLGHYYFKDFEITFILLAASGFLCYTIFVLSLIRTAYKVSA